MADIHANDPDGASSGQAGSGTRRPSEGGPGMAQQARETLQNVGDRASDTWDDLSKRGARYYRQGSRAVGEVDGTTATGLLIAGAIGFGLAWLIFGQASRSGDYVARRMSSSSERMR
ncbi:hypothetical protein U8607_13860 [Methylobacterium durans]|uniref:hypothetical protein n=1 Tax=Methylobacterium durans TaxID=2202825 RepID=UPI002AFE70E1|nr:hypothetical protein [Methylobacterium durans]MEA1833167.1 hypothetical protein [Methylobacterium durans]